MDRCPLDRIRFQTRRVALVIAAKLNLCGYLPKRCGNHWHLSR